VFESATNSSSLSDTSLDEIYVEPRFSGDIAPMFAWQANFQGGIPTTFGGGGPGIGGSNRGRPGGVHAPRLAPLAPFPTRSGLGLPSVGGPHAGSVGPFQLQRPVVHEPLEVPGPLPRPALSGRTEAGAAGPQQRRHRLGRIPGRQAEVLRRRLRSE